VSSPSRSVWGRTEQQDFRSRVRGCLLGAALGDALGAGPAALRRGELGAAKGQAGAAPAPRHRRRGDVTYATQQTLFTLDGLIRAQIRRDVGAWHPPTDVHRAHLRWAATQREWGPDERRKDNGWLALEDWLYARRDPPLPSLLGLGDEVMGTPARPKNPGAQDAGAVVRSAPFGLLVGWEPQLVCQLALECAVHTHGHPDAYLSAGAFAMIVHAVTRGESLETAVQGSAALLAQHAGHEPVADALHGALSDARLGVPDPGRAAALAASGGAQHVLAAAVYCALVAQDMRHGLRLAADHDGDTVATGAVCGALLGALHGETALPPGWLAELEGRGTLLLMADDFAMELTQGPALHGPSADDSTWLTRYPSG
jgi:ADP-ribosylglycohydrolase